MRGGRRRKRCCCRFCRHAMMIVAVGCCGCGCCWRRAAGRRWGLGGGIRPAIICGVCVSNGLGRWMDIKGPNLSVCVRVCIFKHPHASRNHPSHSPPASPPAWGRARGSVQSAAATAAFLPCRGRGAGPTGPPAGSPRRRPVMWCGVVQGEGTSVMDALGVWCRMHWRDGLGRRGERERCRLEKRPMLHASADGFEK